MSDSQVSQERWKYVVGTEWTMRVSTLGRVIQRGKLKVGRKFAHVPGRGTVQIGRLVLELFVGPCPDGMECCHWDDNPTNNVLNNLRWATRSDNMRDSYRNGHRDRNWSGEGENHSRAKLTSGQVIDARHRYRTDPKKWTGVVLAKELGVSHVAMYKILSGKTYRNVP